MLMVKNPTATGRRERSASHDSFLRYRNFRWAKIAGLICIIAIAAYLLIDVKPHPSGSTAEGYVLGTIGAMLILWLTLLGVRKRAMTPGRWSLRAWTSAHVYLGLSLIVIATLHTGFQFGWNVHTLAYALMMLVILSGIWGISMYGTLPQALSDNREMMTETQMLEALRSIDRQLHDAAQPLPHEQAALVLSSLAQNPFGGGLWARLTGRYRRCATRAAQIELRRDAAFRPKIADDPLERVDSLLERKSGLLARVRRHLKLKALLEVWLYVHVPVTFALIAALSAHIVSVFFYW